MTTTRAPIIVGVDGSDDALRAVRYAAKEAAQRRRPLRVVHAFIWPLFHVPPTADLRNQANLIVKDAVDIAAAAQPGLDITGVVVTGTPAPVLVAESHSADMIVIGDRGLGGFAGLLLGSTAAAGASADSYWAPRAMPFCTTPDALSPSSATPRSNPSRDCKACSKRFRRRTIPPKGRWPSLTGKQRGTVGLRAACDSSWPAGVST